MNNTSFKERFKKMLPYIDPDSPRFIDWVYAERMGVKSTTVARNHNVPNYNETYTIKNLIELIEYDDNPNKTFVYTTNKSFRLIELNTDDTTVHQYPVRIIVGVITNSDVGIIIFGDEELANRDYKKVTEYFSVPKSIEVQMLLGFRSGDDIVKSVTMRETDKEQYLANNEFYPHISNKYGSIENLVKQFEESRSSVLLLIGSPGTGKSTFLRTMMFRMKMKHYISCNNEVVLRDPNFNTWIQNIDDGSLVVIEDADTLCQARSKGNTSMSTLLNLADGVVKRDIKLVISTNLASLSQVDPALIRAGRSFDVIEFPALDLDEANKARVSVGMNTIESFGNLGEKVTLSEALHIGNSNINRVPTLGFSNKG